MRPVPKPVTANASRVSVFANLGRGQTNQAYRIRLEADRPLAEVLAGLPVIEFPTVLVLPPGTAVDAASLLSPDDEAALRQARPRPYWDGDGPPSRGRGRGRGFGRGRGRGHRSRPYNRPQAALASGGSAVL